MLELEGNIYIYMGILFDGVSLGELCTLRLLAWYTRVSAGDRGLVAVTRDTLCLLACWVRVTVGD